MNLAQMEKLIDQPVDLMISVANKLPGAALEPYVALAEAQVRGLIEPLLGGFNYSELKSPNSQDLPLMNPFHVILFILGYFLIVAFGRAVMSFLPPFKIKGFTMVHNIFLLTLSAYMMVGLLFNAYYHNYSFWGNDYDRTPAGLSMAKFMWIFFISKIFEFIDTFIMVLKKNDRQISILHLYHHCSVFAIWWLVTYMAPGGDAYYCAALNCFIHVIMYGYYFLSALGVSQVSFVKRYITMMQMTQFVTNMIQAIYDVYTESYSVLLSKILFVYMISLLILFGNFFIKDQQRAARERKERSAAANSGTNKNLQDKKKK